ncbi:MAG: hypothetical protein WA667_24555 [Candidatus Nitrosopolaris sp.]
MSAPCIGLQKKKKDAVIVVAATERYGLESIKFRMDIRFPVQ